MPTENQTTVTQIPADRGQPGREREISEKKETAKGTQFSEQRKGVTDLEIPNRTIEITQTNHPGKPIYPPRTRSKAKCHPAKTEPEMTQYRSGAASAGLGLLPSHRSKLPADVWLR